MRIGNIITGLFVVAGLIMGTNAWADVITPGEADYAYEGDAVPPSGGWDELANDDMTAYRTDICSGGIFTRNATPLVSSGIDYYVVEKHNVMTSLTFTVDFRMARDIISSGTTGIASDDNKNIGVELFVDLDGAGAGTAYKRLMFTLGHGGITGTIVSHLEYKDSVFTYDAFTGNATGRRNHDNITGLNVDEFNIYRIVGMGDGTYRVYLNDVVAPIVTGTMKNATDVRAGGIHLSGTIETRTDSTYEVAWKVDYIRVLSDTARDEAPMPPFDIFVYEGNDVPPVGGWDELAYDLMTAYRTDSSSGGIFTRNVTPPMSSGINYYSVEEHHALNSTTFTVDFRMARDIISGTIGSDDNHNIGLDIFADLDGAGSGTAYRRLIFTIGQGGISGVIVSDLTNKDCVFTYDAAGRINHDGITGLNVDEFNVYRIVGMGDNTYKVYLNNILTPIVTGTMSSASGGRAGDVQLYGQIETRTDSTYEADWKVDYIYVLDGTALDEAPMPPTGTLIVIE